MSPESPNPFSSELVKQITEASANFIRWIAELIRHRNLFMLLVLAGVMLSLAGLFFRETLDYWLPEEKQDSIWASVSLVAVLLFIGALIVAVITMPRRTHPSAADIAERRAIKGLRPFGEEDAEIFKRLQRDDVLRDCLEAITSPNFRIGVLMGESGSGKTSFLQAGLLPQLNQDSINYQAIYIRFSNQDPIETVINAISEQLEIPMDSLIPAASESEEINNLFLKVLQQATEVAESSILLIFDQFEQFFAHFPRKSDRVKFIQALTTWYQHSKFLAIKILVSIRSDLYYQLYELQEALGYVQIPQDIVPLEKFNPDEAVHILEVIAETESLRFDRRFMIDLATEELANPENELISPVDLQILAWMIERQKTAELRAFNRESFQKFGGVEGLLTRFLDRTLATLALPTQRQTAVKVLLQLTDLERQVRAEVQTLSDLQKQLRGDIKAQDVAKAVHWLVLGNVRLITPVQRQGQYGYELAHERLIPALMRQMGQELTAADKAKQLLDRRVNEWLGNSCSSRYLLNWKELRLISQNRSYIFFGTKRVQKEKLLRLSRQKLYRVGIAIVSVSVMLLLSISWFLLVPEGQIQVTRLAMSVASTQLDDQNVSYLGVLFGKDGNWPKAFRLVNQKIRSDVAKVDFLKEVCVLLPRLKVSQTQALLSRGFVVAETVTQDYQRAYAFSRIAKAAGQVQNIEMAQQAFSKALSAEESVTEDEQKVELLRHITNSTGQVKDSEVVRQTLSQIITRAESLTEPGQEIYILNNVTSIIEKFDSKEVAYQILSQILETTETITIDAQKAHLLRNIINASGQLEEAEIARELLSKIVKVAETITNNAEKIYVLSDVSNIANQIQEIELAREMLSRTLQVAEAITEPGQKAYALNGIVSIVGQLQNSELAREILSQALENAKAITEPGRKVYTLNSVANVADEIQESEFAQKVISQAFEVAETTTLDYAQRADIFRSIAYTAGQIKETAVAKKSLLHAIKAVENIYGEEQKAYAFSYIAEAAGQIKDSEELISNSLSRAIELTQKIPDDRQKTNVFYTITSIARKTANTDVAQQAFSQFIAATENIVDEAQRRHVISDIVREASQLKESSSALEILSQTVEAVETFVLDEQKAILLNNIANTLSQLESIDVAQQLLNQMFSTAESISDNEYKAYALQEVVDSIGELGYPSENLESLLDQALTLVQDHNLYSIVNDISVSLARLGYWQSAMDMMPKFPIWFGHPEILSLWAEKENPALISGAVVLNADTSFNTSDNDYNLVLAIKSPDIDCTQHADWWEVLSLEGDLLYRQFIPDIHDYEQPFEVVNKQAIAIPPHQQVFIRAHLHLSPQSEPVRFPGTVPQRIAVKQSEDNEIAAYTDHALLGSLDKGFHTVRLYSKFTESVALKAPQPPACPQ